mmetsp:Transcript_21175/g.51830  ORF Transcript_21175/g.51830 Transcript_21175/m.51830 type:complete len:124 (-) Transcript_21175:82-453(-)
MEKIIRDLTSALRKVELLMEELREHVSASSRLLSEANSSIPLEEVCSATNQYPSMAQMAQWMETIYAMYLQELIACKTMAKGIGRWDVSSNSVKGGNYDPAWIATVYQEASVGSSTKKSPARF